MSNDSGFIFSILVTTCLRSLVIVETTQTMIEKTNIAIEKVSRSILI